MTLQWRAVDAFGDIFARVVWDGGFADCNVDYLGGDERWRATVIVPRPNGSTQPPAERHSAYRLPSREAAQAWCERAVAFAQGDGAALRREAGR